MYRRAARDLADDDDADVDADADADADDDDDDDDVDLYTCVLLAWHAVLLRAVRPMPRRHPRPTRRQRPRIAPQPTNPSHGCVMMMMTMSP